MDQMISTIGKKRKRAASDSDDECNGSCKNIAKREVFAGPKRSKSFALFWDDSGYTPLTPSSSLVPQSDALRKNQSDASLSGDSAYISTTPLDSVMPASNLEPESMDMSSYRDLQTHKNEVRWYQQNYRFLKEQIEPLHKIVDVIISYSDDNLSERIQEAKTRELRADILLKYAAEHLSQQTFESILRDSGYGHVIDDIRKGTASKTIILKDEDEIDLSNEIFKDVLYKELEPKQLIDRLLEHDILSFNDHNDILETDFRRKRVEILFRYLELQSKDHQIFIAILKEEFPFLLGKFKEAQSAPCKDCGIEMDIEKTFGGWKLPQLSDINVHAKIKVHLKMSPASTNTERRIIKSKERNMEVEVQENSLHLKMESLHLGSVIIIYKQLSRNAVQKLKAACESNEINEYVKSLFSAEDIERMKQDNVNTFVLTVTAENHEIETDIHFPVITKEAIVRNFSFIEKEIKDAEVFFAGFLKSGLLTSESKTALQKLKSKAREERNIEFLNFILRGQPDLITVFQQELVRLGFEKILNVICHNDDILTHDKITEKVLKENESYLLSELEPKEFLQAFVKILPEEGLNKIKCTVSRRERAKLFLDDVIKRGQPAVDIFVSELTRLDRHFVVEILTGCGNKYSVNEELAASKIRVHILDNYAVLINELEPKSFQKFFLERRVIKEETFEKIIQFSTQRNRAVAFLKWLVGEGSTKALIAFQAAVKLFCDDAVVKMLEAPMPFVQSGPSLVVANKTKEAIDLYKGIFKITFHDVSGSKIGSEQKVQESSFYKKGEHECDGQSLEEETCMQFSAQNPIIDEDDTMSVGFSCSFNAGSMQKTKHKCHSLVSSHSSKSRKQNHQNKDLIPNESIFEKVAGWLLQKVTEDSNSWASLSNDLAPIQMKPLLDCTCASLGDFSRNTTESVSGSEIGNKQVQESSVYKGEEDHDWQSLEEGAYRQFLAQKPSIEEDDTMSFGFSPSLNAGSMQKTKHKCYSLVSSHSSKSRKLNDQNKDFIPKKSISHDEKVTRWLLQNVAENSLSWAPLPNDLASVQVKPLSDGACTSLQNFSRSSITESDMKPCAIQDGKSEKSCRHSGKGEQCIRSTIKIRKDYGTNMTTMPELTCKVNDSVEDNFSISDQGYISHQDLTDFEQATISSITSPRFFTRALPSIESNLPTFEESEQYNIDCFHTKSPKPFRNSKESLHPHYKRYSFKDSNLGSLFASGTCSSHPFHSMESNVASPLPCIDWVTQPNNPVESYFEPYGIHSFPSPSSGVTGSVPSPSSHFDQADSCPSPSSFSTSVGPIFSANSLITTHTLHNDIDGNTENAIYIDKYNEKHFKEGVFRRAGKLLLKWSRTTNP